MLCSQRLCITHWKLATDSSIEIVHVHSASGSSFWRKSIAIRIAKAMGRKVIFHCHGGGFKEFKMNYPKKLMQFLVGQIVLFVFLKNGKLISRALVVGM